ncbi:ice-binding family protein [Micromonospora sp. NPDC049523]|uniref:ice-binding family protein n=1 Tax=Micromonospora sp. NPDC049523 TaxID=3155921 RepID=UPI003449332B
MPTLGPTGPRRRITAAVRAALALTLIFATSVVIVLVRSPMASALTVPVPLGTAADFAVLGGTTVTNTGLSVLDGDLGVSPGATVSGFPPGVVNGDIHQDDAAAIQAQIDLTAAYNDAAGRTTTDTVAEDLGGTTLPTGVYESVSGAFELSGALTLDAEGDPNAVFIFKAASTLTTTTSSTVTLANGAQSCNVFWQIGSSATLGTDSTLRGDILASASISSAGGADVDGRALAINGQVSLDTTAITASTCAVPGELSITAPASVDLGSASPEGTLSGNLGPVTVTDERLLSAPSWVATVVAADLTNTDVPGATISNEHISYWSGIADTTGAGTFTSGQPTADDAEILDEERIAYTLTDGVGDNTATWDPFVTIEVPLSAVAGSYTGTITFSVA